MLILHRCIRGLIFEKKASSAMEFAIIASVFFLVLCGIFTLALDMYWQLTLDTATRAATRKVQIGDITTGTAFLDAVCSEFGLVSGSNCVNSLQYSVQNGSFFGTQSDTASIIGQAGSLTSSGLSKTANFPTSITSTTTGLPQFLFVQVAVKVPFSFMQGISAVVAQNSTNYLYSAVATVVEP